MKKKSSVRFLLFAFCFVLGLLHVAFFIVGCSSPTSSSKGSLTGVISLEGLSDYSNITVSLYDLAYLDTTIVRINHEYPHIGVIINQHTEFDHRLQSPVATSTTLADGSFIIEEVPTGVYNFVAQKEGFGFRYIYEISISEGENEISNAEFSMLNSQLEKNVISSVVEKSHSNVGILSGSSAYSLIQNSKLRINNSPITLFEELHLSGDVNDNITVAPFHHLVCDDDVTFIPGSSLEIQSNAVVRIAPGADLKIMGNFKAQGGEDNMFWVTSNHGFENDELLVFNSQLGTNPNSLNNSKLQSGSDGLNIQNFSPALTDSKLIKRDSLALYNSMSLEPTCIVSDDLIEWGKWSWGNTILMSKVDNLRFYNSNFSRSYTCLLFDNSANVSVDKVGLFPKTENESNGLYFSLLSNSIVERSIMLFSDIGIKIHTSTSCEVKNNVIMALENGILNKTLSTDTNIIFNNINSENIGILNAGESTSFIYKNEIYANIGLDNHYIFSHYYNAIPTTNNNNFYCSNQFLINKSWFYEDNVILNAENNWWNTTNEEEISDMIWDRNDENPNGANYQYLTAVFDFTPIQTEKILNAGVQ